MKKTIPTLYSMFFICIVVCDICGQYNASDINTLKKQLNASQLNTSQLQQQSRLLKQIAIDSLDKDSLLYDTTMTDTTKAPQLEEDLSIYENMIQKNIINPDSLIKKLKLFGHTVFRKSKSPSFFSNNQISVPADYNISSGDEIIILLWGRINEENRLVVDRNGKINIPRIGPVSVAGMPFTNMQKNISDRIQSIEGVQASVSMGTLSDIRIFVVGEVNIPGQYTVSALTNVINALFYADGFSKNGSLRNVVLKRNGQTIQTFDFYDFLLSGNNFNSVRLKTGDVLFVPIVKKMAAIAGNVRRSALYELNGKTTLKGLIDLAGGLIPTAWVNRIQVERFLQNQQQIITDFEISSPDNLPDFEILDGDLVKIFPIVKLDSNAIFLSGNVLRPGKYAYRADMKVSDIINSYDQLLPETYFNYAIIRRQESPSFSERIISFNLGNVLETNTTEENIHLKPLDHIVIYNQDYFEPDRTVSIDGSVNNPGTYKLYKNMRIKDLILEAGGLSDEASADRGELYKRMYHKDSIRTEKINFSIMNTMQGDPEHNLPLSKFDHISVRQKKGWEKQKLISLIGEFNYPGTYVVLENETLGDIIKRAGGFKPEAYLAAAIYTRESVKVLEKKRLLEYANKLEMDIVSLSTEMSSKGGAAPDLQALLDQQKKLLDKLRSIEPVGRIVIDFEKPESYKNLQIEHNDILYSPKNNSTVSVIGEVFNPSTFVLENENPYVDHYIQLAGGYKTNANKKDVYVIKANGSVRTRKMVKMSRYDLDAGDAIVIPLDLPSSNQRFKLFLETSKDILAITSSTLLIAVTIRSLNVPYQSNL